MRLRLSTRRGLAINISNRANSVRVRLIDRVPGDLPGDRIQRQVGEAQRGGVGVVVGAGPAQQGAHPGQKLPRARTV